MTTATAMDARTSEVLSYEVLRDRLAAQAA